MKILGRGKTYPHREWFRKSGFDWNARQRQWEKQSADISELDRLRVYAADRFELLWEDQSHSESEVGQLGPKPPTVDQQKHSSPGHQEPSVSDAGQLTNNKVTAVAPVAEDTECDVCGRVIPPARLTAIPGTTLCVVCAEKLGPRAEKFIHEPLGTRDDWRRDRASWKKTHT